MRRTILALLAAAATIAPAATAGAPAPDAAVALVPAGGGPCPETVVTWIGEYVADARFACATEVESDAASAATVLEPEQVTGLPPGLHPYLVVADGRASLRLIASMRGDRGAELSFTDRRGDVHISLDLVALEANSKLRILDGPKRGAWFADFPISLIGTRGLERIAHSMDKPTVESADSRSKLGPDTDVLIRFLELFEALPHRPQRFPEGSRYAAFAAAMEAAAAGEHATAVEGWLTAAKDGHGLAQYALARHHLEGRGGEVNVEEGLRWLRESADAGFAESQYHLGYLYAKGEGPERDPVEALRLFMLAGRAGHPDASTAADALRSRLEPGQIARAEELADRWNPCPEGRGGEPLVTRPRLISGPRPEYPELPRVARLEGRVLLTATILGDGSVADVSVLRVDRPNMGFEEAAADAVRHWLYEPATRCGRPIDVYFTVVVDFDLH